MYVYCDGLLVDSLANKQDVDGALDEIDLVEGLKVEEIVNKYKCPTRVETCSAIATRNRKPDKPIADGFRLERDRASELSKIQKNI